MSELKKPNLAIIVAMTKDRVIGIREENKIPWYIPEDFKHFKETTLNSTVIMGKTTWDSLPKKPLPKRNNIVLCNDNPDFEYAGIDVVSKIDDALIGAEHYGVNTFIMGGASIYRVFLPLVNKMIISFVKGDYKGDVYFPDFRLKEWDITQETEHPEFIVKVHERKRPVDYSNIFKR